MPLINTKPVKNTRYFRARILIIEDDEPTASVLHDFFQMFGYECITIPFVVDIVDVTKDVKPSLIIMDYLLPKANGGEMCGRLKRDVALGQIPVIICSAYNKEYLSLDKYLSDAFIAKPFDLDDLLYTVHRLLYKPNSYFPVVNV
ncbi:response regulator [Pedobacter sp. MC2016-15]|uniref:response regulator n=1 Tax=Pedobacter sp. MC2016-15 TaxID=2994473 RepID=UPI002246670C|nr:response regulator [Pedobacter sp. MC2016-15]MCX2481574.1 response regulator [Pedobacter sp. MC2016-15]